MVFFLNTASLADYRDAQVKRARELFQALSFGLQPIQYEFVLKNDCRDKAIWSMKTAEEFIAKIPTINEYLQQDPFHVWFRPNVSSYIFIDDLSLDRARIMFKEGYEPSAVIETSPDNYQVWVCVANVYIRASHATTIARYLAERFGGDPSCCNYRHYGRMVGFPNVKEQYRTTDDRYPITRLHYAQHTVISKSHELLVATKEKANAWEKSRERIVTGDMEDLWQELNDRLIVARKLNRDKSADVAAEKLYRSIESAKLLKGIDVAKQRSETDLAVVCQLIHRGYSTEAIAEGLRNHSFRLEERKKGHVEDYLRRTIERGLLNVIEEKQQSEEVVMAV